MASQYILKFRQSRSEINVQIWLETLKRTDRLEDLVVGGNLTRNFKEIRRGLDSSGSGLKQLLCFVRTMMTLRAP